MKPLASVALLVSLAACKGSSTNAGASTPAVSSSSATAASDSGAPTSVALQGGSGGIGFDDLVFAPGLRKVLAPAGATGRLALVDPDTFEVTSIPGFTSGGGRYQGGHGEGTTSADEGRGLLFAIDRTSGLLDVVDPLAKAIVASSKLAGSPDYVRFVPSTGEVWVTEPDSERIEIFSLPTTGKPVPISVATIAVKGGPESLVIHRGRDRAFTHLWNGSSVMINPHTRAMEATWSNGCSGSRGIAVDERRDLLFAGCAEGKGTALSIPQNGKIVGTASSGSGVDVIAYSPALGHLYLPGASSATMAILAVGKDGSLSVLGTVPTVEGAHCVTADDRGRAWVCDPSHGRLLIVSDGFTASP